MPPWGACLPPQTALATLPSATLPTGLRLLLLPSNPTQPNPTQPAHPQPLTRPGMYSLPSSARAHDTAVSSFTTSSAAESTVAPALACSGQPGPGQRCWLLRAHHEPALCSHPVPHATHWSLIPMHPAEHSRVKVGLSTYWMSARERSCTSYMSGRQYTRPSSICGGTSRGHGGSSSGGLVQMAQLAANQHHLSISLEHRATGAQHAPPGACLHEHVVSRLERMRVCLRVGPPTLHPRRSTMVCRAGWKAGRQLVSNSSSGSMARGIRWPSTACVGSRGQYTGGSTGTGSCCRSLISNDGKIAAATAAGACTWKYLPHTKHAYTLWPLSETEQHFSKSKSRFCAAGSSSAQCNGLCGDSEGGCGIRKWQAVPQDHQTNTPFL